MTPLLVLDSHYLCHRAFHAQGELSFKGKPTAVVFGFLKSIVQLKEEFQTDRVVFCFEHPELKRREIFPGYKKRRHDRRTPQEVANYRRLAEQIAALREDYLQRIGFSNVFCFPGMESDDIMAAISRSQKNVILVTADADLWQCLSEEVCIYVPTKQKLLTRHWFVREYGFEPRRWALVKALAGCHSDCVPGIAGVGEATAIRYVRGQLAPTRKAFLDIRSDAGRAVVRRNRQLVELPFAGCPEPVLRPDAVTEEGWLSVCKELGMRSLAGRPPILSRIRHQHGQGRFF